MKSSEQSTRKRGGGQDGQMRSLMCFICSNRSHHGPSLIIRCSSCHIPFHNQCFEDITNYKINGDPKCQQCSQSTPSSSFSCLLCGNAKKGLVQVAIHQQKSQLATIIEQKQAALPDFKWVHTICLKATQTIQLKHNMLWINKPNLDNLLLPRAQPCCYCLQSIGEIQKCGKCQRSQAHIYCAKIKNLVQRTFDEKQKQNILKATQLTYLCETCTEEEDSAESSNQKFNQIQQLDSVRFEPSPSPNQSQLFQIVRPDQNMVANQSQSSVSMKIAEDSTTRMDADSIDKNSTESQVPHVLNRPEIDNGGINTDFNINEKNDQTSPVKRQKIAYDIELKISKDQVETEIPEEKTAQQLPRKSSSGRTIKLPKKFNDDSSPEPARRSLPVKSKDPSEKLAGNVPVKNRTSNATPPSKLDAPSSNKKEEEKDSQASSKKSSSNQAHPMMKAQFKTQSKGKNDVGSKLLNNLGPRINNLFTHDYLQVLSLKNAHYLIDLKANDLEERYEGKVKTKDMLFYHDMAHPKNQVMITYKNLLTKNFDELDDNEFEIEIGHKRSHNSMQSAGKSTIPKSQLLQQWKQKTWSEPLSIKDGPEGNLNIPFQHSINGGNEGSLLEEEKAQPLQSQPLDNPSVPQRNEDQAMNDSLGNLNQNSISNSNSMSNNTEKKGEPKSNSRQKHQESKVREEDLQGFLLKRSHIISFEQIWWRFQFYYLHRPLDLVKDFQQLKEFTLAVRCKSDLAKNYITNVVAEIHRDIYEETFFFQFKFCWNQDYEEKIKHNHHARSKEWYKSPGPKRDYVSIDKYQPAEGCEEEELDRVMTTSKKASCSGDCCLKYEDLGELDLTIDSWKSNCECRSKKVECTSSCPCFSKGCKNREISEKRRQELGNDVIEADCWGVDLYTAINIINVMPENIELEQKNNFIEFTLMNACQKQKLLGYDLRLSLKWVIKNLEEIYTETDLEIAQVLISAFKERPRNKRHEEFRVHSKGLGIICNKKEGIKKNQLIIEYFGELYSPWRWYEKQDVIKTGQNKNKISKDLPDFYNINFERHPDDPEGYNTLTVDPIIYGAYSSRLSHSCRPNCATVSHVVNGKYSIGMFAIRDVQYGEELTFHYNSVTESEKEYETAICLCGTSLCSGKFLSLAISQKQQNHMKNYHTFMDRNHILYKACQTSEDPLSAEQREQMSNYGFKDSLLNDQVPNWLKKWVALISEYMGFELKMLKDKMLADGQKPEDVEIELKNTKDSRTTNVTVTVNKVMHVIKRMGVYQPPVLPLSISETLKRFWGFTDEKSFYQQLFNIIDKIEESPAKSKAYELLKSNYNINPDFNDEKDCQVKFVGVLDLIKDISEVLRGAGDEVVFIEALCDVLYLYANTQTYFIPNPTFKKIKSSEVRVRNCDVKLDKLSKSKDSMRQFTLEDFQKCCYRSVKEYEPAFVWGQLIGWFKQTVDKPNASLSADRRGTLSYPDLESFLISKTNPKKSGRAKKSKKFGQGFDPEDEDVNDPSKKNGKKVKGTRSRPTINPDSQVQTPSDLITGSPRNIQTNETAPDTLSSKEENQREYPHKKYNTRIPFLKKWKQNFSKQWDVNCKWNFKNKQKMYGSVQLQSLISAGNSVEKRLDYFNNVVDDLIQIQPNDSNFCQEEEKSQQKSFQKSIRSSGPSSPETKKVSSFLGAQNNSQADMEIDQSSSNAGNNPNQIRFALSSFGNQETQNQTQQLDEPMESIRDQSVVGDNMLLQAAQELSGREAQ